MKKSDITQIRITVQVSGKPTLNLLLDKDGTINRQGSGTAYENETMVLGMSDGTAFKALVKHLDGKLLAGSSLSAYDHPDKKGDVLEYEIVFIGKKPLIKVFKFSLGSQSDNVGEVFPYFLNFTQHALSLTEEWYRTDRNKGLVQRETITEDTEFLIGTPVKLLPKKITRALAAEFKNIPGIQEAYQFMLVMLVGKEESSITIGIYTKDFVGAVDKNLNTKILDILNKAQYTNSVEVLYLDKNNEMLRSLRGMKNLLFYEKEPGRLKKIHAYGEIVYFVIFIVVFGVAFRALISIFSK